MLSAWEIIGVVNRIRVGGGMKLIGLEIEAASATFASGYAVRFSVTMRVPDALTGRPGRPELVVVLPVYDDNLRDEAAVLAFCRSLLHRAAVHEVDESLFVATARSPAITWHTGTVELNRSRIDIESRPFAPDHGKETL